MRKIAILSVVVVGVLAALLVSCKEAPTDSGIRGLVTIGPISPVEQPGIPNSEPYSATIVVKDADGDKVDEVTSGVDGRFTVTLAPGAYVLEPQSPDVLPYATPQDVIVEPHRFTEVTVPYDSGIR